MQSRFFSSLFLLLLLNALVKPVWIFFIDRKIQLLTGNAYGDYFSLLHLALVPAVIADAGILSFYTKTAAADAARAPHWFRHFFKLKLVLATLYLALLVIPAWFLLREHLALVILLGLLQLAASFYLFFRAHTAALQLYRADAVFSVADKLLVIILAGSLIYWPLNTFPVTTTGFILIQLAAYLIAGLLVLAFLWPRLRIPAKQSVSLPGFAATLKQALPYAAVVLLMTVLYRFDAFLLYRLHPNGQQEAAQYAGGFRLLDALNMAGFLTASFLLPLLGRGGSKKHFSGIIQNSTGLLLLPGIWAAGFCWLNKEWVTRLLYGEFYAGGEFTVAASVSGIIGCLLVHIYSTVLTAAAKTRILSVCAGAAAILSITTNVLLAPRYGALGVAVTAAVIQLLFAVSLIIACYRNQLPAPQKSYWLRVALFLPAASLIFFLVRVMPVVIQMLVTISSTIILGLLLKLVSPNTLKQPFTRNTGNE